ncbi:hypothetical protein BJ165DRAFT_1485214 [Panaeolus papilionaceus]|nr:hypothetical protein BJ165DRAFT_1485214 [Panaeolus papilionaceus]
MHSPPPLTPKATLSGPPKEPLLPVEIIDTIIEEAIADLELPQRKKCLLPLTLVSHTFAALANRRLHESHCIVLDFPTHTQYYNRINSIIDLLERSQLMTDVGAVYNLKRLIIFAEGKSHITHLFMDVLESPQFAKLLSLVHGQTYGIREFDFQLELGLTGVWRWSEFPRLGAAISKLVHSPTLRTLRLNNLRGVPREIFFGARLHHLSLVNIRPKKFQDTPSHDTYTCATEAHGIEGSEEAAPGLDHYSPGSGGLSKALLLDSLEVDDVTGIPIDLLHFDTSLEIWDRYDEALQRLEEITFRTEFGGTLYSLRDFVKLISQIHMPLLKQFRAIVARPFCCMSSPTPSFDFTSLRRVKRLTIETDSEEYMSTILTNSRFHPGLEYLQLVIRASLVRTETCRYLARTLSKLPAIQSIRKVYLNVECTVVLPLFDDAGEDFSGKWLSELPQAFQFCIRQQDSQKR